MFTAHWILLISRFLNKVNPVYILTPYVFKVHFNIIRAVGHSLYWPYAHMPGRYYFVNGQQVTEIDDELQKFIETRASVTTVLPTVVN